MKKIIFFLLLTFTSIDITLNPLRAQNPIYDVIIRNGHIIDGTGSPWYSGDIGIKDGRIAYIGNLSNTTAKKIIDAQHKIVTPGFIDMLGQSELTLLLDPRAPSKIYQGVTTEITGEGLSVAPLNEHIIQLNKAMYDHYHLKVNWYTLRQYFDLLQKQGTGINLGTYVGSTSIRAMVLGYDNRQPSQIELEKMKALMTQAMREGALGLSTALEYAPATYTHTEELIELAKIARSFGGIYATHLRNESDTIMQALDEAFQISKEAQIPVEIFHLKNVGANNWGKMPVIIKKINDARKQGLDISADVYPYSAWFNGLTSFMPPWALEGGDKKLIERLQNPVIREKIKKDILTHTQSWDNIWLEISGPEAIQVMTVENTALKSIEKKRLSEIAKTWHKDPLDALFDILILDNALTPAAVFGMSDEEIALVLEQPWVSICTDSAAASLSSPILKQEHPHPRAYGSFSRILNKYVKEEKKLTLPDAIRKFTALPAQRLYLTDRGTLKKGMWADIVVFDLANIQDKATYENSNQYSNGMDYVLVNGVPVIEKGKMTGALPGKVLLGPGTSH